MPKPYSVSLQEAAALPFPARVTAESRYAAALERILGGEDRVVAVYKAWLEAQASEPSILSADTANLAAQWPRAAQTAETAGMHGLGQFEGAPHFELRLKRSTEPV